MKDFLGSCIAVVSCLCLMGAVGQGTLAQDVQSSPADELPKDDQPLDGSLAAGLSDSNAPALETVSEAALPAEAIDGGDGAEASKVAPANREDLDEELLVRAHTAYDEGQYGLALSLYEEVPEAARNGHFHYNHGNVLLRNGALGASIAAFRRGLVELPRDPDVAANLEFARKSAKDALRPPAPGALAQTLLFWHFSLGRSEARTLFLAVNVLLWTFLSLLWLRPSWTVLRPVCLGLAVVWLALAGSVAYRAARPTLLAVVIQPEVNVLSGPNSEATVRFKLHAGAELEVRQAREGWLEVVLPDQERGWLEVQGVETVEL